MGTIESAAGLIEPPLPAEFGSIFVFSGGGGRIHLPLSHQGGPLNLDYDYFTMESQPFDFECVKVFQSFTAHPSVMIIKWIAYVCNAQLDTPAISVCGLENSSAQLRTWIVNKSPPSVEWMKIKSDAARFVSVRCYKFLSEAINVCLYLFMACQHVRTSLQPAKIQWSPLRGPRENSWIVL